MKLRVVYAQIPVTKNIKSNSKAINRAIDFVIDEKADILLTPEGSLSGYTNEFSEEDLDDVLKTIINKVKGKIGLALGTAKQKRSP